MSLSAGKQKYRFRLVFFFMAEDYLDATETIAQYE